MKPEKLSRLINVTQFKNSRCFIQAQGNLISTEVHRYIADINLYYYF